MWRTRWQSLERNPTAHFRTRSDLSNPPRSVDPALWAAIINRSQLTCKMKPVTHPSFDPNQPRSGRGGDSPEGLDLSPDAWPRARATEGSSAQVCGRLTTGTLGHVVFTQRFCYKAEQLAFPDKGQWALGAHFWWGRNSGGWPQAPSVPWPRP